MPKCSDKHQASKSANAHNKRVLIIAQRDNRDRDTNFLSVLVEDLKQHYDHIIWEIPRGGIPYLRSFLRRPLAWIFCSFSLRILYMLKCTFPFKHCLYEHISQKANQKQIPGRHSALRKLIKKLPQQSKIDILGHSSGGRIATLIASEYPIQKIICLGYPFKHPDSNEEPARYQHLANLRTQCLIIQGEHDIYGGREIADLYPLSPAIQLRFINTDHDFNMDTAQSTALLHDIHAYLR